MRPLYTAFTSLPGRYSRALFAHLQEQTRDKKEALVDLETIINNVTDFLKLLEQNESLFKVLMTPTVPRTLRKKILDRLFETLAFHQHFKDFLVLLNQRQRLPLLKKCLKVLKDIYMQEAGIFSVTIKSASHLSKTEASNTQKVLSTTLKTFYPMSKPVFTIEIVPDLLAGCRVEIPGMVLDASFKKQMEQLQTYIHEGAL